MPVHMEQTVDPTTAAEFYDLYLTAFGPLRARAAARQVLHRDEFFQEMSDPRVWKYVARDLRGAAIGLTTLTAHLETVPWISADYFAAHFPEQAARGAVYYLGFTLVHPSERRSRLFTQMIGCVVERLVADRAVCAYDICAYNNVALRFADNIESVLHRTADVSVQRLDTQTYYGAVFTGEAKAALAS